MSFLKRAKAALRDETSLIIVKENTCEDGPDGGPKEFLDEEDSSLTRYVFLRLGWLVLLLYCSTPFLSISPLIRCFAFATLLLRLAIAVLRHATSCLFSFRCQTSAGISGGA